MDSNFYKKMILIIVVSFVSPAFSENSSDTSLINESSMANFQTKTSNSSWEEKDIDPDFYNNPYQISLFNAKNGEDSQRLLSQTYSIFGLGLGVVGVLAAMPESITNWEKSDLELGTKWLENVASSPAWDRDDIVLNYIMHPYFGGVYYQTARKSGYRQWDAFLYSAMMSTFFWEYGVEAFAETPSLQDIVVTPVLGWAFGEWAYNTEQDIRLNNSQLLGSQSLGQAALLILDPVDSFGRNVNALLGKDIIKAGSGYFTFDEKTLPYGTATETHIGLKVSYIFGDDGNVALPGISAKRVLRSRYENHQNDPINTSIIGISSGMTWINLDKKWAKKEAYGTQFSLGLYFSPSFSTRLSYTYASIDSAEGGDSIIYENYAIDSQYYFNSDADWRPFISAGIGEIMNDEDVNTTRFQVNAGIGLHYKINNNWAIQTDWRSYYGSDADSNENQLSSAILYRFGTGDTSQ